MEFRGDEKEVLAAAEQLAQAQMSKDRAVLESLLGDEIVYSHSNAMVETKAEHIEATMRPASVSTYENIQMKDTQIRVYGNTGVLITKATYSTNNAGTKADNHLTMLQTWVKRESGWQLVARWTTRVSA